MNISDRTGTGLLFGSAVVSVALCGAWYVLTNTDGIPPLLFAIISVLVFFSCRKHFWKPAEARKMPDVSPLLISACWLLLTLQHFFSEWERVSHLVTELTLIVMALLLIGFLILSGYRSRSGGGHA